MRAPLLVLLGVLALGASACSEEEVPYYDGSQTVPLAGLGSELDAAGVDVVAAEAPVDADAAAVSDALTAAEVDSPTAARPADVADGTVGFDPTATAGLISLVTDGPGSTVVLVFAGTDAAAVFAADDPEVFTDTAVESDRAAFLSGNLVAYTSDGPGASDRLRDALESLSGTTDAAPSSTPSSTPSSAAS